MKKKNRKKLIAYGSVGFLVLVVLMKVLSGGKIPVIGRIAWFGGGEKELVPIRVAVFNGCGVNGVAREIVTYLAGVETNFEVVNGVGENAEHFNFPSSIVVDRKGKPEMAQRVAEVLGIQDVILQRTTDPYLKEDVAVIIGKDYISLFPMKE